MSQYLSVSDFHILSQDVCETVTRKKNIEMRANNETGHCKNGNISNRGQSGLQTNKFHFFLCFQLKKATSNLKIVKKIV